MLFSWLFPRKSKGSVKVGPPTTRAASGAKFWRRQSLQATVIKACAKCDAPGTYMSDARIKAWPGCYVDPTDQRLGQPVGATCPNCNASRPRDKGLGEIWKKEFH